jgi:hypothetical protein
LPILHGAGLVAPAYADPAVVAAVSDDVVSPAGIWYCANGTVTLSWPPCANATGAGR